MDSCRNQRAGCKSRGSDVEVVEIAPSCRRDVKEPESAEKSTLYKGSNLNTRGAP